MRTSKVEEEEEEEKRETTRKVLNELREEERHGKTQTGIDVIITVVLHICVSGCKPQLIFLAHSIRFHTRKCMHF